MDSIKDRMSAKKVAVVGVTSEPDAVAKKTMKDWGVSVTLVGNPDNKIARGCIEDGVIPTLAITMPQDTIHPRIGSKKNYPHGCVQPGMAYVILPKNTIFRWAVVPSISTIGGAAKRLDPIDTWNRVYPALSTPTASTPLVAIEPGRIMGCFETFCCLWCCGSCQPKVDPNS